MAARIGELLVRNGLITEEQLERALQAQLVFGGRLGTNLVELGYISTATLAEFLASQLGMPCLRPAQLSHASQAALETLDPDTASRFMVFPLESDGRVLHLAMADPTDLRAVDEVAFRTGKSVKPVVAPELLVVYALERYYHVKRANRFMRLATSLGEFESAISDETAGAGDTAEPARTPSADSPAPYDLRAAVKDLLACERHAEVLAVAQRYLRGDVRRVVVLVMDDERARAWSQAGCHLPPELVRDGVGNPLRHVELDGSRSALVRGALRQRAPEVVPMSETREDRILGRLLEVRPPDPVLCFPVRVGERNEAIILGAGEARDGALAGVERYGIFASKVTDAIRMVRLRKRIAAV